MSALLKFQYKRKSPCKWPSQTALSLPDTYISIVCVVLYCSLEQRENEKECECGSGMAWKSTYFLLPLLPYTRITIITNSCILSPFFCKKECIYVCMWIAAFFQEKLKIHKY